MPLRQTALEDVVRRELIKVCFHEASHSALIQRFGGIADARVWANPNDSPDEKRWLGQCKMYREPPSISVGHGALTLPLSAPKNWRVLVGMAGLVGELIAEGDVEPINVAAVLETALVQEEISDSDRLMIGTEWSYQDVEMAVSLLTELWPEIEAQARWLQARAEWSADAEVRQK